MEELMVKIPSYIQFAALIIAAITVIASIIVKITPSTTDDEKMMKVGNTIFKVMAWLPFFGTDPRLKNMAKAFENVEGTDEPPKAG